MRLLQPRPPNKILCKLTNENQGVNNKFSTSKRSKQATHYIINTFVIIFLFFQRTGTATATGKFVKNLSGWPWLA